MLIIESIKLNDLPQVAKQICSKLHHSIIILEGDMGVGKTTLSKQIIQELGAEEQGSSPTFSIVNEYGRKKGKPIYHFDFYRIQDEEEALDLGIEEYFYSGSPCLIEWAEKIPHLLPELHHCISLKLNADFTRTLNFN